MIRAGIMSDSHGTLPKQVYTFFEDVDVILHAGDIGSADVLLELQNFKKTIAVTGNIDAEYEFPRLQKTIVFNIEQVKVILTHIGGYPNHYPYDLKHFLQNEKPNLFICGHSHICKIIFDEELNFLHINPGACGKSGMHTKCTLIKLDIEGKEMKNLDLLEYNKY
ncbi:MAG: YfcE family phosphodiesterase [Bacteroidales bacterium]|jgi:putative phosphoesterase|nr:YfcE family phosphodiesterase [Bacteroidales bacterium]